MELIAHRVNRVAELEGLDPGFGLEFDVRSHRGQLILNHEPGKDGEALADFLQAVVRSGRTGTLVFNPKEDGLEDMILEAVESLGIERFFLLDLAMPTLVKLAIGKGVTSLAVRVSEYEPIESTRPFRGKADWVWLDCFSGKPPEPSLVEELRKDFHVCLVSPELQRHPKEWIAGFRASLGGLIDAVCTDHPESWRG